MRVGGEGVSEAHILAPCDSRAANIGGRIDRGISLQDKGQGTRVGRGVPEAHPLPGRLPRREYWGED